jgi:tetratricopeptide (TPR) repeat protein
MTLRKAGLLLFFIVITNSVLSQDVETLNKRLKDASTPEQKIEAYFNLADFYYIGNTSVSDSLAFLGEATAESTRDRHLMVTAYLRNASRFLINANFSESLNKSIQTAEKAMALSRQANDPELMVMCYNVFARAYRGMGVPDKSIKALNDAIALLPDINNDSIKIYTFNSLGRSLRVKGDMLNAFKALLKGLTIAEQTDKTSLIIYCYRNLEEFYIDIKNYEKAKDYAFKSLSIDEKNLDKRAVLKDYLGIANIYASAKEVEMGKFYYEKSKDLADSLKWKEGVINAKLGIVNMYLNSNRFKEGCDLLINDPTIFNYLREARMDYELDKAKGLVQMMLGHYDSSAYYYRRAEPIFSSKASAYQKIFFYEEYSMLFMKQKQWANAIAYQNKAKEVVENAGDLGTLDQIVQNLDSLYYFQGDYKNAFKFQVLHQQYADSLKKLSEQKDILSLEIDNENKRTERAKILEEQELNRRHNLQYMGITAAIAGVFILLVTLGLFRVSASVVKATGFFAFIFLFEFIILILDNQIHHFTHGEPWKVLMIKIVLIAMLLPFHHWLEEKVIHFLIEHRLLLTKRLDWLKLKKKGTEA